MLGIPIQSIVKLRLQSLEEMCLKPSSYVPLSLKFLTLLLILTVFFAVVLTGNFVHFIPSSWIGVLETLAPNLCKKHSTFHKDFVILNSGEGLDSDRQFKSSINDKSLIVGGDYYRSVEPIDFVTPFAGQDAKSGDLDKLRARVEEEGLILKHDIRPPEKPVWTQESESEILATLHAAVTLKNKGKVEKAKKLFEHAMALAPKHPDVLTEFGLFHEKHNIIQAEELFTRALIYSPWHKSALRHRVRTLPLVEEIDNKMLQIIDQKREFFLEIPRQSATLRRAMREAYFQHVYHTVALEGNTMSLVQTRSILETHLAVGGKSVVEHNEILGMDEALRFLNRSLIHRIGSITMNDIKEIHRRVLGYVDPFQAGIFRETQVYVGGFTPVEAEKIAEEMNEFVEWLNSESALRIHPVELAALAHYKFVYIHPFVDGNGRTARLIMNLILMQAGFPPVIIRVDDRLRYYETLAAANEGDLRPFIRDHSQIT